MALEQDGTWTYTLHNADRDTNALAQGEAATDTFQVRVADEFGASDTETIMVTVTGANDAPVVSAAVAAGGSEGSGSFLINLLDHASDVDHGAELHVENLVWSDNSFVPGLPAGFTRSVDGNSIMVDTSTLAYDVLAQDETFTAHFTYDLVDEHGAGIQQVATITVTGTNDAPVANDNFLGGDKGAELLATDGAGVNMIARNAAGNVIAANLFPGFEESSDTGFWTLFAEHVTRCRRAGRRDRPTDRNFKR